MGNQIFEKVAAVIREILKQPQLQLTLETTSGDVDGWDSLHHIMIITEVEKTFNIKIDFMEILEIKSVGDICKAIEK